MKHSDFIIGDAVTSSVKLLQEAPLKIHILCRHILLTVILYILKFYCYSVIQVLNTIILGRYFSNALSVTSQPTKIWSGHSFFSLLMLAVLFHLPSLTNTMAFLML